MLGRRLGSPIDPQLTLFDARTGRELPGGHSNDAPGLQTDARLTYTFKDAGDYLVEIRDVSYKGGEDYFYRLRIGDFPCATTPLPLAVKRGTKATVRFAGPNVDGVAPVEVTAPTDPAVTGVVGGAARANGLHGWPVSLAVSDLDEALEQEPNNEPAKANRIAVPGADHRPLRAEGRSRLLRLRRQEGQALRHRGHTHELHSPTEVYMALRDAKGKQMQATDPMEIRDWTSPPPADGDYFVAVEHLHYWGGPDEVYRLTFAPYQPGFDLSLGLDRYDSAANGSFAIPILADPPRLCRAHRSERGRPARRDRPGADAGRATAEAGAAGRDADGQRRP